MTSSLRKDLVRKPSRSWTACCDGFTCVTPLDYANINPSQVVTLRLGERSVTLPAWRLKVKSVSTRIRSSESSNRKRWNTQTLFPGTPRVQKCGINQGCDRNVVQKCDINWARNGGRNWFQAHKRKTSEKKKTRFFMSRHCNLKTSLGAYGKSLMEALQTQPLSQSIELFVEQCSGTEWRSPARDFYSADRTPNHQEHFLNSR